jgi:secreted PhoX family phosphatase
MTHLSSDDPIMLTDTENDSSNPEFNQILTERLSRRSMLKGSFGVAATLYFGGSSLLFSPSGETRAATGALKLNFAAVPKTLDDKVTLAQGYSYRIISSTGDPLADGIPAYSNNGSERAESFNKRVGDHHDGMHFFGLGKNGLWSPLASDSGLLCVNHESVTAGFLHPAGPTIVDEKRPNENEVLKEMLAIGMSIAEVKKMGQSYKLVQNSRFNRRVTSMTDIEITGPAARSALMITKYSVTGTRTRGTIGNCANGHTPWGTYLTCEENWAFFFRRPATDDSKRSARELASLKRYGVKGNSLSLWATVQPDTADNRFGRWDASINGSSSDGSDDYRNAPNTFGWVVEIDPFNPDSTPKKRTALGRFAHEGAWPGLVIAGQPLVWYMGCDSRHEYIYKYVSNALWDPADAKRGAAAGDKYLNDGTLYVARFNADGSGDWLELTHGRNGLDRDNSAYSFNDQADVLIHARLAADARGATKMDRPEWGAVNPKNGEVYMTLTFNPSRALDKVDAANPRFYNDPKKGVAQKGNANGHIIRWAEHDGKGSATHFQWDVFLFAARSSADPENVNISGLTADNDFSSPDGLWFARSGLLWVETDDHAYTDVSNCMLLAAIPGKVGDGSTKTIVNSDNGQQQSATTHVGAAPGEDRLRRFLVGPVDCEITGLAETPDGRALFVNIQHPGETTTGKNFNIADPSTYLSHWPQGGAARPRSSTIVITRDDGGLIGADLA